MTSIWQNTHSHRQTCTGWWLKVTLSLSSRHMSPRSGGCIRGRGPVNKQANLSQQSISHPCWCCHNTHLLLRSLQDLMCKTYVHILVLLRLARAKFVGRTSRTSFMRASFNFYCEIECPAFTRISMFILVFKKIKRWTPRNEAKWWMMFHDGEWCCNQCSMNGYSS